VFNIYLITLGLRWKTHKINFSLVTTTYNHPKYATPVNNQYFLPKKIISFVMRSTAFCDHFVVYQT